MRNYFCIYLMHFSTNKRKKWDFFSTLIRCRAFSPRSLEFVELTLNYIIQVSQAPLQLDY